MGTLRPGRSTCSARNSRRRARHVPLIFTRSPSSGPVARHELQDPLGQLERVHRLDEPCVGARPSREPRVLPALQQDHDHAGVRLGVLAERPCEREGARAGRDLVRHDHSGRSRSAAVVPSSPLRGRPEPQLLPEPPLDAADRKRHQLARTRVGRDQQDVHAGDATRVTRGAWPRAVVWATLGRRAGGPPTRGWRDGAAPSEEEDVVENTGKAAVAEFVATFALIFIGRGRGDRRRGRAAGPGRGGARPRARARDHGLGHRPHLRRAGQPRRHDRAVGDREARRRAQRGVLHRARSCSARSPARSC